MPSSDSASLTSPSRRRRIRRHVLLGLSAAGLCFLVDRLLGSDDLRFRLSMATAYASLAFLVATLVLGPLRVLRGRHSPANTFLRRDIGIWAGTLGLLHVGAGLTVHFRGDMWKYFFARLPAAGDPVPVRLDAFGVAVYTGTASALVLVLLLALSNNRSLRTLGTARWKGLQRWNYAAFLLMAVHGTLFQLLESRALPWVVAFGLALGLAVVLQAAGFVRRRAAGRHGTAAS